MERASHGPRMKYTILGTFLQALVRQRTNTLMGEKDKPLFERCSLFARLKRTIVIVALTLNRSTVALQSLLTTGCNFNVTQVHGRPLSSSSSELRT